MNNKNLSVLLIIISIIALSIFLVGKKEANNGLKVDSERTYELAAKKWLAYIDAGNYHEAWEAIQIQNKEKINSNEWEKHIKLKNEKYGNLKNRRLLNTQLIISNLNSKNETHMYILYFTGEYESSKNIPETMSLRKMMGEYQVLAYQWNDPVIHSNTGIKLENFREK